MNKFKCFIFFLCFILAQTCLYAQEFEVDWQAAVRGSYYSHQLKRAKDDGRITRVLHESKLPVFAVFDLGTGADDYTACWFFQCFRN